jgi:hypothetical protein
VVRSLKYNLLMLLGNMSFAFYKTFLKGYLLFGNTVFKLNEINLFALFFMKVIFSREFF